MGLSPGPSQPVKALQYLVEGSKVSLALVFLFLVYFLFSPALWSSSLLLPRGDLPFSYLFLSHFMLQWRFIRGVKSMICHDSPTSPAELRVESSICAKLCTPVLVPHSKPMPRERAQSSSHGSCGFGDPAVFGHCGEGTWGKGWVSGLSHIPDGCEMSAANLSILNAKCQRTICPTSAIA